MKQKAAVAMSGGVDSSLTAALLLEAGYEVFGITMQLPEDSGTGGTPRDSSAPEEAAKVAGHLGIRHYVMDLGEEFRQNVMDYFLKEYASGRTPNPCITCNHYIKFGSLYRRALELGADIFATGHYARIEKDSRGRYRLKKGTDHQKDQSYVLYTLNPGSLPHLLFPLGNYTKDNVRSLAEAYSLPVAHKPDSQEICFIPGDDYKSYLRRKAPECLRPGDIVDTSGQILGRHEGVPLYTIGQRRGLGIAAPEPLYVIRLESEKNRVVAGSSGEVFSTELTAGNLHWLLPEKFRGTEYLTAKIRYGKKEAHCSAELPDEQHLRLTFREPQRAITPGQSVVLYDGDYVLGGGTIL